MLIPYANLDTTYSLSLDLGTSLDSGTLSHHLYHHQFRHISRTTYSMSFRPQNPLFPLLPHRK